MWLLFWEENIDHIPQNQRPSLILMLVTRESIEPLLSPLVCFLFSSIESPWSVQHLFLLMFFNTEMYNKERASWQIYFSQIRHKKKKEILFENT